jgi:hypothetical protein
MYYKHVCLSYTVIYTVIHYYLITKKINRFGIVKRGDLRLHLTFFEPNVKKIGFESSSTTVSLINAFQNI